MDEKYTEFTPVIRLAGALAPSGSGTFPVARACDIMMPDNSRLDEYLDNFSGSGESDPTTVWEINETPDLTDLPPSESPIYINFNSAGTDFVGIFVEKNSLVYKKETGGAGVFVANGGWAGSAYRTVTFPEPITNETLLTWLKANATLKSGTIIEGVGSGLPMVSVSGYDTITVGELVTTLRSNGITANDTFLIDLDGTRFIGQVKDPTLNFGATAKTVAIPVWFALTSGMALSPFWWAITEDTLVKDLSTKSAYQLKTQNQLIIPAINELYDKIPSADTVEMPIIRFVGAKSRRADTYGDEEFPPTEMNLTNGISFIVEMTGGGSIQSGDSIQICQMKTYWYGEKSAGNRYRKQKLRCVAERVIEKEYLQEINRNGWKYLILNSWETNEVKLNAAFCHNGRKDSHRVSSLYIRIRRPRGDLQNNESGRTVDAYFSNVVEITRKYSGDKMHFE